MNLIGRTNSRWWFDRAGASF